CARRMDCAAHSAQFHLRCEYVGVAPVMTNATHHPSVSSGPIAMAAHSERQVKWRPTAKPLEQWLSDPRISEPPLWIMPPLVQSGEVALLSAPPKTGKSQFVSQLAA